MGMAGGLATITAGFAPVDTNPVFGLCLTSTPGLVLRGSSAKHDGLDSLEKEKPSHRRQGADGIEEYFRPCTDSGLVEPEMQKIPVANWTECSSLSDSSGQSNKYKGFKEHFGGKKPTAHRMTGRYQTLNFSLLNKND